MSPGLRAAPFVKAVLLIGTTTASFYPWQAHRQLVPALRAPLSLTTRPNTWTRRAICGTCAIRLVEPVDGMDYIVVATTRPETMLGDTGVAVSPKDPERV